MVATLVEKLNAGGYCLNVAFGYGIRAKIERCGCGQDGHGFALECVECGESEWPTAPSGVCLMCAGVA